MHAHAQWDAHKNDWWFERVRVDEGLGVGVPELNLKARVVVKGFGGASTDTSFLAKNGLDLEMFWITDDNNVTIRPITNQRYSFSSNNQSFVDDANNIRSQIFTAADFTFAYALLRNSNITLSPTGGASGTGVYMDLIGTGTDAFLAGDDPMKFVSVRPTWTVSTATNNGNFVGYYYDGDVTAAAGGNIEYNFYAEDGFTKLGQVDQDDALTKIAMLDVNNRIYWRDVATISGGGSGETNTASNLGGGLANYSTKVGVDLQFNSFLATDFDLTANVIGIDYTNAQKATTSTIGFLTDGDWDIFNTVDQPLNQIFIGTGTGATSSSLFTFDPTTNAERFSTTVNVFEVLGTTNYFDGLFQIDDANGLVFLGDHQFTVNGTNIVLDDPAETITIDADNGVIFPPFAGGGTRMVTADNSGILGVTAIPTSFTDELAQDAVGGILVSPLVYTDGTPSITLAGLSGLGTADQILGMNTGATAYEYKSFAFGATGTAPNIVHTANTMTLNYPLAASGVTSGTISASAQSIAGVKTFTSGVIINVAGTNVFNVGTTVGTFRTTNAGGNTATQSMFDVDASNSTAGAQGFGFEDVNGFILTAANGTRRIMRAFINIASLDNTAGSEDADLIFGTQAAGAAAAERFRITNLGGFVVNSTNTTAGTTGDQTINKPSGTVNIATGNSSITVTNSLVTANSLVFAVVRTNDAAAIIKNVVPGAGSFVITLNAATGAETSIGFFVIN